MATGMADYSSVIRLKYGAGLTELGGGVAIANDIKTLLAVIGRGMLYGGVVFLMPAASQKTGFVHLDVDGNRLADLTFENLNRFGVTKPQSYPVYLLKYDEVKFEYCVAISHGITFETGFELTYEEQEGVTPTVFYHVCYTLI